ncbi:MAG TPA: hypothetical protein GXX34_01695 [Clostridia bacterium]|nr:hypothetical protein [Clostridia bacterium]
MIIYSVMPPEWKLAGFDDQSHRFYEVIDGIQVELAPVGENTVQVARVISTNPQDFLHPQVQPGQVFRYAWKRAPQENT